MFSGIACLTIVMGFGLLVLALEQRRKSLEATHWPKTEAIIRASDVVLHPGMGGGGNPTYAADVQYDYVVNGQTYHGTCISAGLPADTTRAYPGSLVLRYATGCVAQVHHHPTDPGRAVLEIRPRGAGVVAAMLGFLFVLAGGGALTLHAVRYWMATT